MKEDDLQSILNLMVFEDKLDVIFAERNETDQHKHTMLLKKNDELLNNIKYKISHNYVPKSVLSNIPCTFCPVFKECQIDNIINPKDCPYMGDFLKFFDADKKK